MEKIFCGLSFQLLNLNSKETALLVSKSCLIAAKQQHLSQHIRVEAVCYLRQQQRPLTVERGLF